MRLFRAGVCFAVTTTLWGQTAPAPAASGWLPPADPYTPLTPAGKVKRRALRLIEPTLLVNTAISAGINQWRDIPHAWGQGAEGSAIRFASAEGFAAAHNTVALGFDLALHLDPRYRRMPEGSVSGRLWNAVSQTFIAYRDDGGRMVNVSEIGGSFGAGFISNAWQPPGFNSPGDAVTRGLLTLVFHTSRNVAREFLPDLMHRTHPSTQSPNTPN